MDTFKVSSIDKTRPASSSYEMLTGSVIFYLVQNPISRTFLLLLQFRTTWLLFPFDLVNWLPFCPALGYFYMFFIFNMRCLFAPRFAPNYVIRRIRSIYKLTPDRLAVYLQSGSFFQLIGIPILYTGIEDEQKSNKAFTLSRIELLPLTVLQR